MTKAEKEHYDKVARLGCILCRLVFDITDSPAEIHHIRRFGTKRSNADVVGLCPTHHRLGNTSFHGLGAKGFEKHYGISCQQMVDKVKELIE
jgi:hypothetical protein